MKLSIIILFLLLSATHKVCSQAYEDNYKAAICKCIEAENPSAKSIEAAYNKCFKKHMVTYAAFIDSEIKEDDKTQKYIKGQKVRLELQQRFKYELISSCDFYFNTINDLRQLALKTLREMPLDSTQLDRLNQKIAMNPHWQNYFERAKFHFKQGHLKKSEQDLLQSIEANPHSDGKLYARKEKLLLAWVYENQGRYNEAITIYDEVSLGINDHSTEMLKAIVSRRKGGHTNTYRRTGRNNSVKPKPETVSMTSSKKVKPQESSAIKTKDSSKSLRDLFKL